MAAGRNLRASFILSLQDGVSAGLGRLKGRLDAMAGAARRIGLLGAGVAALSFAGPIAQAAAYDTQLRDLANTHGLTGAAADAFMTSEGRRIEGLARQYRLLSRDLMGANNVLAANALSSQDRLAILPEIARLSAAERVAADDAARLGVSLVQNLRIPASEVGAAFAQITQAGREGAVEIRDMANGFPALATAAANVGMTGARGVQQLTAALEIARRGAPDAATAINNLRNVFAKLAAPETVRNFAQFGIDLPAVFQDAQRKGITYMDAVLEHIRRSTGGDPFRMAQLFGDMQAIEGLQPIMQNLQEMLSMRERIAQANTGILDAGLALRMQGWAAAMTENEEATTQLARRLTTSLAPSVFMVNSAIWMAVDAFQGIEDAYPGVLGGVISTGFGVSVLAAALGLAVPALGYIATGLGLLMAPLRMLLMPLRLVVTGLVALGAPVGVAAAAVALLATALIAAGINIWRNWDRFAGFFTTMWAGIRGTFGGFVDFVAGVFTGNNRRAMAGLTAMWDGLAAFFGGLWGVVRQSFADFGAWVDGWSGGAMTASLEGIKRVWDGLKGYFHDLWNAVERRFGAFVSWVEDIFGPLIRLLGELRGASATAGSNPAFSPEAQAARSKAGGSAGRAQAAAGFYAPEAALPGSGPIQLGEQRLRVTVEAAPGTAVREVESDRAEVIYQGSRGQVLGRW